MTTKQSFADWKNNDVTKELLSAMSSALDFYRSCVEDDLKPMDNSYVWRVMGAIESIKRIFSEIEIIKKECIDD